EVDAHVLAQARVVVDDEHERAARPSRGARAVDEELEVTAAVAPGPSGGVEGGGAPLIRPLPDRRLGDAEELRRLPRGQPAGLAGRLPAVRCRTREAVHGPETTQSFRFFKPS